MNERQRDLFLFLWSQRRKPGRGAIGLRGAIIGALGGVLFALIMAPAGNDFLHMLSMAIPAFGFIGWVGADRVFANQERMYHAMLEQGAQIPAQKPVMQMKDRGPAIAVGVAAAIIAGFIIVLIVMASTGAL